MKFVTVMDMWLLIVNLILLGFIGYYGRRLLKILTMISNKIETRTAEKERHRIISIIEDERQMYLQGSSMIGDNKETTAILDTLGELEERILNSSKTK